MRDGEGMGRGEAMGDGAETGRRFGCEVGMVVKSCSRVIQLVPSSVWQQNAFTTKLKIAKRK